MKTFLAKIYRSLGMPKGIQLLLMRITQDRFLVGVTGVIFNDKDEVLLFKHTYRQVEWSLPGGYIKAREHPKEGLEREIKEESGLVIGVDFRLKIRTDRDTPRLDLCYVGKYLGGEFKPSAEVSEIGFFTSEKLPLLLVDQLLLIEQARNKKLTRESVTSHKTQNGWKRRFERYFAQLNKKEELS